MEGKKLRHRVSRLLCIARTEGEERIQRRDVALTFSKDLDYVPVDIFAIDAYVTLQFRNSAEWQELDTLG